MNRSRFIQGLKGDIQLSEKERKRSLVVGANEEICLIRKDFNKKILSDECLNMEVECIENDECILDTVNIHVKKKEN